MKRKTMTMLLCLLTVLSVVGVGFASWVINAGDEEEASGNITVDTVDDYRFTFGTATIDDAIHFGRNNTTDVAKAWLTNSDTNKEKLTVSFTITLTSATTLTNPSNLEKKALWESKVEVKALYGKPNSSAYDEAITKQAIIAPADSSELDIELTSVSDDLTSATYTVTIKLNWGEAFDIDRTEFGTLSNKVFTPKVDGYADADPTDNKNPYEFYNAVDAQSEFTRPVDKWGDDAYYYLDLIEKLGSLTYNVTLTATPTALK